MKYKNVKYIKHEDVPESWLDRCSGDGYKTIINDKGVSMTVKEAEDIIDDIIFIINEFYIYKRENQEQAEDNDDFIIALNESIKYLIDYRKLLEGKIKLARLDL